MLAEYSCHAYGLGMERKPNQPVPQPFGGKNFFPTENPRPIVAICRHHQFKTRLAEKLFKLNARGKAMANGSLNPGGLGRMFHVRPVISRHGIPVCIHRGTHVNTRHNRDYIAPKKQRIAAGEWKGGEA